MINPSIPIFNLSIPMINHFIPMFNLPILMINLNISIINHDIPMLNPVKSLCLIPKIKIVINRSFLLYILKWYSGFVCIY